MKSCEDAGGGLGSLMRMQVEVLGSLKCRCNSQAGVISFFITSNRPSQNNQH